MKLYLYLFMSCVALYFYIPFVFRSTANVHVPATLLCFYFLVVTINIDSYVGITIINASHFVLIEIILHFGL